MGSDEESSSALDSLKQMNLDLKGLNLRNFSLNSLYLFRLQGSDGESFELTFVYKIKIKSYQIQNSSSILTIN